MLDLAATTSQAATTILGGAVAMAGLGLTLYAPARGRLARSAAFVCYLVATELLSLLIPGISTSLRVFFGIGAVILFGSWDRTHPLSTPVAIPVGLPLINHLKLKLREGQTLVRRLDPAFPDIEVLKLARAWQIEVYRMLVAQRKDLAQKFLDGSDFIEERETRSLATVNPAHFLLHEHTICLEGLIQKV